MRRLLAAGLAALLAPTGAAGAGWVEVNPTGDAEAGLVAVSGTGDSRGLLLAASGTGGARGIAAASGTGEGHGLLLGASAAGRGACTSELWCAGASIAGPAVCDGVWCLAAGGAGAECQDSDCAAMAVAGDAVCGTYDPPRYCVAVSVLGHAGGTWAVSPCDAAPGACPWL